MKRPLSKAIIARVLAVASALSVIIAPAALAAGPTTVNLLTTDGFAVLAATAVTNVPTSVITGNVGLSPAAGSNYAGITAAQVTGTIYAVDASGPAGSVNDPSLLTTAKNDLTTAYLDAAGRTPTTTFVAGDNQLGGQTLTSGVYRFGHASTANITAASPLVLDAQGDPSAVFIFQATSDLVTASSSVVQLVNGAQACNVFWQIGSSATLGSSSTFIGTIMALTSVTVNSGVTVSGRVMARNAAVTLDADTITRPTCTSTPSGSTTTTDSSTTGTNGSESSTPGLPNTGTKTNTSSLASIILPASAVVLVVSVAYILRKKRTA